MLLGTQWYVTHHHRLLSVKVPRCYSALLRTIVTVPTFRSPRAASLPWPSGAPFILGVLVPWQQTHGNSCLWGLPPENVSVILGPASSVHFLLKEVPFEFSTIHREYNHVGRLRFYVANPFWQVHVSKPSDHGSSTIFTHAFSVGHHCACVSGTYPSIVSGLVLGMLISSLKPESEVSAPLSTTIPYVSF